MFKKVSMLVFKGTPAKARTVIPSPPYMPPPPCHSHADIYPGDLDNPDLMQIVGMLNGETAYVLIMNGLITGE